MTFVSAPTLPDVAPILRDAVPEFLDATKDDGMWTLVDEPDPQGIAFTMLGDLRLWLLDARFRRNRAAIERAWNAAEHLAQTTDPILQNALMVGLLEGAWPSRHRSLMGPRTQALYADVMRD